MTKEEFIVVISTAKDAVEAQKLADMLVKERAAACVSISSPVFSVYTWQGQVEKQEEVMMFIKTVKSKYPEVERLIRENHSYEVPEIIALPVCLGEEAYLQWITANTVGT